MRVLYFGDASWGMESLNLLIENGIEVLGVVIRTHPTDGSLEESARRKNLPLFQPANCNAPEFLDIVKKIKPDLNISVSYDQILRPAIIDSAPMGFINFHAGKLPYYRGRSVINWAIINGEDEVGITGHFVDEGIDTGDIILQQTLPVAWEDDYNAVLNRVVAAFPQLVLETTLRVKTGNFERIKQSHLPGSYFPRRGEGDEWLDWLDSSRNLYNKIRGISAPAPGAATMIDDRKVVIWKAHYDPSWPNYIATPGQVVGVNPEQGVLVKTGDSTLLIQKVQYVGENEPHVPKWRIGRRLKPAVII
ncbi:methionyl-tRNA formyltransferase [Candidatus Sumerlaeota bacterium]|nr:methionyl-tRNA formyltransferase [Candidatus Sumerlaeota bacterium]